MPLAIVPEGLEGLRADVGAARLFGLARSVIEQAAESGDLRLDGRVVRKSVHLVTGMMLEVDVPEQRVAQVRPRLVDDMHIIYDDADLVVVDKPAGIAAHPSLGWDGGSVVEHLVAAGFEPCPAGPPERPGIVSRLDVGTSGLMVVALSELAFTRLKRAFTDHEVNKVYHALVQGYPDPMSGTIDAPIGHAHTDEWKMAIDAAGRAAVTHYSVIEAVFRATLLRVQLETGRTHQIRVHMAAIHHPCVGDVLYGADPHFGVELGLRRQWLHAVELGFDHPRSGQPMVFTSQYPPDLANSLAALRSD